MRLFLLSLLCFFSLSLLAQERISLDNPSFEDAPQAGKAPQGWTNCGPPDQTPPDVHPNDLPPYHFFDVRVRPNDGWSYLGMVARDNGTWEAVCQRLPAPMLPEFSYLFGLYLVRSEVYNSGSRLGETDFSRGAVLRIWGGMAPCDRAELLALTVPVDNVEWLEYIFTLVPSKPWTYLTFEAYYAGEEPYNCHILLDNCSNLLAITRGPSREELEAMDEAGLEKATLEAIRKYADKGLPPDLTKTPLAGVLYKTWEFEQKVAQAGLRRFVLDTPFAELTPYIRALEAIRLQNNLALLKEVARLSLLDSKDISPQEYQFFENADMKFRENEASESIQSKRLEFIKLHRGQLIEEISSL